MTPTKEQIEKAREAVERQRLANSPLAESERRDYETILFCLTPPEPAASEADVAELRRTIERLEADRRLAVEGLKKAVNLADREIARYPHDKYAIGTRHDCLETITKLTEGDKP